MQTTLPSNQNSLVPEVPVKSCEEHKYTVFYSDRTFSTLPFPSKEAFYDYINQEGDHVLDYQYEGVQPEARNEQL